jgi:response regulator RpfG family c-di-GMP phosphodiesterase
MTSKPEGKPSTASVLIVDGDIISRHAIADYLRHCGYSVVEANRTEEAFVALLEPTLPIDVILCEVTTVGSKSCFELSTWVRTNRPELEVKLAGGLDMAVQTAAQLCDSGPNLARPYDPQAVVDYIKRLRASRL